MKGFSISANNARIDEQNNVIFMELTPIIGLEIHVELKTKSKMFCPCKNDPESREANINVCPICLAHPGTLPLPNKTALSWTVLIGKALHCSIREISKFDRKHYFYPDLPKGYQISQYDEPIAEHGSLSLSFPLETNIRESATITIRRAHLEEDTAKLLHDQTGTTLVDFNRAGTPLVEIVTNPDFKTALEAKIFAQELQKILRYLKVSDANLEKGQMRIEANISVQKAGAFEIVDGVVHPLGNYTLNNKVEVKNINSFRAVEKAILFEIDRQGTMIAQGESWPQETRGWDEDKSATIAQRSKENAADYRYFPEPDIPPFHPEKFATTIMIPELPQEKRQRFHEEFGFSYTDAEILTNDQVLAEFAEAVMIEINTWLTSLPETKPEHGELLLPNQKIARLAGSWLTNKLLGMLYEHNKTLADLAISAENFAELVALLYAGRLNATNAQKILNDMVVSDTDLDPTHVMEEKGYGQVSDEVQIQTVIIDVIKNNPVQVEQYRSGKTAVFQFLKGMVMKATEGSADPAVVEKLLRKELDS